MSDEAKVLTTDEVERWQEFLGDGIQLRRTLATTRALETAQTEEKELESKIHRAYASLEAIGARAEKAERERDTALARVAKLEKASREGGARPHDDAPRDGQAARGARNRATVHRSPRNPGEGEGRPPMAITRDDLRLKWMAGRDWMTVDELWSAAANEPWRPATKARLLRFMRAASRCVPSVGVESRWDPRGGDVVQWRVR